MGISFYMPDSTPAAIGGIDEYTVLMMHMDGDQSGSSHTITHNGDPQFSTAQSKFGGSSMLLDGTGDYLSAPDHADWDFGSGDFTIDFWMQFKTIVAATPYYIFAHRIGGLGTDGIGMFYQADVGLRFFEMNSGLWSMTSSPGSMVIDTWYHIAVVKNGSDMKLYMDGIEAASGTNASIITRTQAFYIAQGGGDDYYPNCYVDEFRISKGTARWTSNFDTALPTEPYESDADTKLLLHMDGDVSDGAHVVTSNGTPQLNAATTKFDGAMYFDGTGDYLSVPDSDDWYFGADDFTMDFWVYRSSGSAVCFITQYASGSSYSQLQISSTWIDFNAWDSGNIAQYNWPVTISDDTWYHIVLTRDNSHADKIRCAVNGTFQSATITLNVGANTLPDIASPLYIGYNPGGGTYLTGYIDEFRISKGTARWTSNFTPESGPYTE